MTKEKKTFLILFSVLAAVFILAASAKPLYNLYRDVSFYWVDRSETEKKIKAFAEENHISYGEYPQFIIDLMERNPETEKFVCNYPFRKKMEVGNLSGISRETVPLFLQWDTEWGYEHYGSGIIAETGCGPTCLAMAGYYLTGDLNMSPDKVAKFAEENGYYEKGYGSSWTLISEGAGKLGLKVTELPLVEKKMVSAVEAGKPVILAMGPGIFTSTGHYIVLTGVEDGAFRVNDPNSRINSQRLWSYEELEGEIRNIWAIEK